MADVPTRIKPYLAVGFIFCYLFGWLGLSILWIAVPFWLLSYSLAVRHESALKNQRAIDLDTVRSTKLYPDQESSEWFNVMLHRWWHTYREDIEVWATNLLNPILDRNKPNTLDSIQISRVMFGTANDPIVEYIKSYRNTSHKADLVVDMNIKYTGMAVIELCARVKNISMNVNMNLGIDSLVGKIRIRVQLQKRFPWAGCLQLSFLQKPKVELSVQLSNVINLMEIPGISNWLKHLLTEQLLGMMIHPRMLNLPFDEWMNPAETSMAGILQIHLIGARDLMDKNILSSCHPYCVVKMIGGDQEYRSSVSHDTNPVWDEDFDLIVDNIAGQSLSVEVFDKSRFASDTSLGSCVLTLRGVVPGEDKDLWLTLNAKTGAVHLSIKFQSLLDNNPRPSSAGSTAGAPNTPKKAGGPGGGFSGGSGCGGGGGGGGVGARGAVPSQSPTMNPDAFLRKLSNRKDSGALTAPVGVLEVLLVEAVLSQKTTGSRSLFCQLWLADEHKQSGVVKHKAGGEGPCAWNESFKFIVHDPKAEPLNLKLMRKHSYKEDTVCGQGEVGWVWIMDGLQHDFWMELDHGKQGSSTVHLKLTFKALSLEDPECAEEADGKAEVT